MLCPHGIHAQWYPITCPITNKAEDNPVQGNSPQSHIAMAETKNHKSRDAPHSFTFNNMTLISTLAYAYKMHSCLHLLST